MEWRETKKTKPILIDESNEQHSNPKVDLKLLLCVFQVFAID